MEDKKRGRSDLVKILAGAFLFSGGIGLVYEVLWFRMLSLVFGSTTHAMSILLASFMGGLALGSHWLSRRIAGIRRPIRLYAFLELGIGAYALLTPWSFGLGETLYAALAQDFSGSGAVFLRFFCSAIVLIIPTALMGATWPVMILAVERNSGKKEFSGRVGMLYGLNTLGAVLGTMICGFALISELGVRGSLFAAAALQIMIGLVIWAGSAEWEPKGDGGLPVKDASGPSPIETPRVIGERRLMLLLLGSIGFTAMVYEIGWTRMLTLTIGSTVYSFALVLAAFLTGISMGSLVFSRIVSFMGEPKKVFGIGLAALGLSALLLVPVQGRLPLLYLVGLRFLSVSFLNATAVSMILALIVTWLPCFFSGMLFPAGVHVLDGGGTRGPRLSLAGQAYAANALGAVLGALAGGFLLIRVLGTRNTLLAMAGINLAGAAAWAVFVGEKKTKKIVGLIGGVAAVSALLMPGWDFRTVTSGVYRFHPDYIDAPIERADGAKGFGVTLDFWKTMIGGGKIVFSKEGIGSWVSVLDNPRKRLRLMFINGKPEASAGEISIDMGTQILSGHLPMVLADKPPERAMIIGMGSGVTLSAVLRHPVKEVDLVEIEPAVIEASSYFDKWSRAPLKDPRVNVVIDDARHHLFRSKRVYDSIISEPSNPFISGISNLFTEDFYRLVESRLAEDGIFCQWIYTGFMTAEQYKASLAAIRRVFPDVTIWRCGTWFESPWKGAPRQTRDTLVIARKKKGPFDMRSVQERMAPAGVSEDFEHMRIRSPWELFSLRFIMGGRGIGAFVGRVSPNTDDRPTVEFATPKRLYQRQRPGTYRALLRFREPFWRYAANFSAEEKARMKRPRRRR